MKIIYCCLSLLTAIQGYSQKLTEEFTFKTPETIVSNSRYNNLHLIDLRDDTASMGIVQKGAFNRKARVIATPSLSLQVPLLLQQMTDSSAGQRQLQLIVREMSFTEVTTMTERGYYFLRADLYGNTGKGYALLDQIDTVVVVRSMDVTKATLRNGSKHITKFIADNLQKEPVAIDDAYWSYEALTKIDSIEKTKLPLYTKTSLAEGVYDNYTSFKNQEPNRLLFTVKETDAGGIASVSVLNEKNKYEKISPKKIYAVVYKGQPFVATEYGYYLLRKKEDDWFFYGKYKTAASGASMVAAGFFFGIIGAAIAADAGSSEYGDMKIDYITGTFKVVDSKAQK
ncbi:MAG: hypothetical protein QM687_03045 [Ferruginibacter sp.]